MSNGVKVSIGQLSAELQNQLRSFADEVREDIDKAVDESAEELKKTFAKPRRHVQVAALIKAAGKFKIPAPCLPTVRQSTMTKNISLHICSNTLTSYVGVELAVNAPTLRPPRN